MNVLENNLKFLKIKNPQLAEKIEKHTELMSSFSLDESKSGDANLKKNEHYLHDEVDPEQEAINLLRAIQDKSYFSFNFIYGLGLGYVLKRFFKGTEGFIIVYEHDLDVLRLTFEMVDFSDELSDKRVFIINDLSEIEPIYKKYYFHDFKISSSICNNYQLYDYDNLKKFINYLGYIHGIYSSNYQTYWDKNHGWISALSQNLNNISNYAEAGILKDIYKNKPAVIISAGPSLDKNIDLIAKYQDNYIIFCVGNALKTAMAHGVVPDFVCFVESHPVTFKMLSDTQNIPYNLILQPITLNKLYDLPAKDKFVFYADNDPAAQWSSKLFNIDNSIYINRGTVSVNALVSAKIMGCNPIIMTGQDLAYTGSKCYAKGSIYDNYVLKDNEIVVDNLEDIMKKTDLSQTSVENRTKELTRKLYTVKGQNGEDLSAPGDYASFIKYFSDIAEDYKSTTKLYNATEGGAQIDGYENVKFADLVPKYLNKSIDKSLKYNYSQRQKRLNIMHFELDKCISLYEKIYSKIFYKANAVANTIKSFEEIEKPDAFKTYSKELSSLLYLYKEYMQAEKSTLFRLITARNEFFIDYYIKNIDNNEAKNHLLKYLYYLFKIDFEEFIKPEIEMLKNIK